MIFYLSESILSEEYGGTKLAKKREQEYVKARDKERSITDYIGKAGKDTAVWSNKNSGKAKAYPRYSKSGTAVDSVYNKRRDDRVKKQNRYNAAEQLYGTSAATRAYNNARKSGDVEGMRAARQMGADAKRRYRATPDLLS